MNRRQFIFTTAAAGVAGLAAPAWLPAAATGAENAGPLAVRLRALLRDWGDALVRLQVNDPARPEAHGAFHCPACGFFHGRGGDAVLPLLALAEQTGEARYLEAALRAVAWLKNVDAADGSWTNELDPKSWKGTTVFTAIAQAEALEWHGKLIPEATRTAWRERLKRAGEYIFTKFTLDYGNVNYGVSGAYALALMGKLLDEERFRRRGRELAHAALARFTPPDHFLFGEGHPADRRSAKGAGPVDLGYNVEESLPNLIHYALLTEDQEVFAAAVTSFKAHLEFMLPDGGWDNSWGTRSFKWTYWGSRTSDGCLAAFARLAARAPVFAAAAQANAGLLRACTQDGLLHGGPHYASHGVKPCVHHTFVHAKAVAGALHYGAGGKETTLPPLPRARASGLKHFPDVDVTLAAIGAWRATFSGYDWFYQPCPFQASGGAPGILWHEQLGPVLSASLAEYLRIEPSNMQLPPDGEDFPLTARVERRTADGGWFTNLHDGSAKLHRESTADALRVVVETRLLSAELKDPPEGPCRFQITYVLTRDKFSITAQPLDKLTAEWSLVLPVISKTGEVVRAVAPGRWEFTKPAGRLIVSAATAIERMPTRRERVFNLVPGFEAVPLRLVGTGAKSVECSLQFIA